MFDTNKKRYFLIIMNKSRRKSTGFAIMSICIRTVNKTIFLFWIIYRMFFQVIWFSYFKFLPFALQRKKLYLYWKIFVHPCLLLKKGSITINRKERVTWPERNFLRKYIVGIMIRRQKNVNGLSLMLAEDHLLVIPIGREYVLWWNNNNEKARKQIHKFYNKAKFKQTGERMNFSPRTDLKKSLFHEYSNSIGLPRLPDQEE